MKYQYKIDDQIEFQTDSVIDFINYLEKKGDTKTVLTHLLNAQETYIIELATQGKIN